MLPVSSKKSHPVLSLSEEMIRTVRVKQSYWSKVFITIFALCSVVALTLYVDRTTHIFGYSEQQQQQLASGSFNLDNVEIMSWEPRVFLHRNFLSHEECDHIIKKGEDKVTRSKVVGSEADKVNEVRTSFGTFMSAGDDEVMKRVEERVSKWSMLPISHQEQFYLLRYQNGQKYEAHHDYFHKNYPGMDRYIGQGQRMVTVLMYLQAPEEGGETYFPTTDPVLSVKPRKGDAVLFHDMTPNAVEDPNSLHGSAPVKSGTKWALTKWIRIAPWGDNN